MNALRQSAAGVKTNSSLSPVRCPPHQHRDRLEHRAHASRDRPLAKERHLAHERRLPSKLDRERVATRHASIELAKELKARRADQDAARTAREVAQQTLLAAQSASREAETAWSKQLQAVQIELARLRERAAAAVGNPCSRRDPWQAMNLAWRSLGANCLG